MIAASPPLHLLSVSRLRLVNSGTPIFDCHLRRKTHIPNLHPLQSRAHTPQHITPAKPSFFVWPQQKRYWEETDAQNLRSSWFGLFRCSRVLSQKTYKRCEVETLLHLWQKEVQHARSISDAAEMFMLFGGLVADDNYFVCSSNKFTDLFSNQWSSVASSSRKIPKSNNLEYQQNVPANEDLPMPLALVAHSPETPGGNSTAAKAKGVQVADTSDAVESEKGSPLRVSLCTLVDRFELTASTLSFTTSRLHSVSPKAKAVVQNLLDLLEVNLKDFSNEQFEEFAGLVDSIRNLDILEEHQSDVLLDMSTQLPGIVAELQTREAVLENAKEIMINLEEYLELSKQEKELRRRLQECLTKKEEVMKRRDELNAKKSELMEEFPGSDARSNMAAMSSLEAAWYFCKTSLGRILKFVK